uniref:Uncharacterized protein n=1 Tax=Cacopsylla melanoneura TaxID=428564 RepID=A0A8D8YD78_9HEMI
MPPNKEVIVNKSTRKIISLNYLKESPEKPIGEVSMISPNVIPRVPTLSTAKLTLALTKLPSNMIQVTVPKLKMPSNLIEKIAPKFNIELVARNKPKVPKKSKIILKKLMIVPKEFMIISMQWMIILMIIPKVLMKFPEELMMISKDLMMIFKQMKPSTNLKTMEPILMKITLNFPLNSCPKNFT